MFFQHSQMLHRSGIQTNENKYRKTKNIKKKNWKLGIDLQEKEFNESIWRKIRVADVVEHIEHQKWAAHLARRKDGR